MKRSQKNALAMAGLMTVATLFSAVPAMADDVITVDFWTAPQQVQYDYWEAKAQAFNETKTEVNGKIVEVKVQQMPETPSSEAGIQNAIATGTAPAVSENINRGFAATLAASEVVYDLSLIHILSSTVRSVKTRSLLTPESAGTVGFAPGARSSLS